MRLIKWLIEFFNMKHVPPIPSIPTSNEDFDIHNNGDDDAPEWLAHNGDKK